MANEQATDQQAIEDARDGLPISPDVIRACFAAAMSEMYRREVPLYGTLLDIVAAVNRRTLDADPALRDRIEAEGGMERLSVERHGAIRLGTAEELATCRRLFAVMGMEPVGYYDLSVAGVPVHSTAFRPVTVQALSRCPFRIFTSLLRLELIEDNALRAEAEAILARRRIFSPALLDLLDTAEAGGGLTEAQAERFVNEALETFRWHPDTTVSRETYERLNAAHRLIADVVCFRGPHINHLTPRTLDIDAVQAEMIARGIPAKAVIEGPPRRACPILLRQTSFTALEEQVAFQAADGRSVPGSHTARFGEVEQRGVALTPAGRALYDRLLDEARGADPADYAATLERAFAAFPDDLETLRGEGLAYFRYLGRPHHRVPHYATLDDLVQSGAVTAVPLTYEDFLPVSAAGIFQSNLGGGARTHYAAEASRSAFETALGTSVADETAIYAAQQAASLRTIGIDGPG
ncbi:2-oxoadipate dioxygenase/decarboxylase HglS [Acidomonas methanolica]|uniref:2-oxoadipate dioxygenase/decarboxylase n=1 Tax=Acidomonas methanolica NBRC 104435 TaxID=1231351 RepID=A0A023D2X2_ACIMT|nr:VOC family protein [Acidomonas methanolica]TCS26409.1 putative glyoxalase superfamily metalloenzyme YdcJ [Acidomonas methanolica]GAJ28518.1 hypothetical protein Amme_030_018 [Acidomonas methanolica NBRC 104435]GBQ50544.1 hypothetical protein AA0498_1243 [Acidomonas methanolica]GEK99766.1 DUF1338 domain-containing protein [Acidomonas methanolica NBRC 104435]